jgi:hypothetical protein
MDRERDIVQAVTARPRRVGQREVLDAQQFFLPRRRER